MTVTAASVREIKFPALSPAATASVKGYWVERRYEGERTAPQVVVALMKVHERRGAA